MGDLNWVTPMNQSLGIIQPVWLTFARIIKLGISGVTGRYQSHFGPIQMNQNVRQDMQRLHSNSVQKVIFSSIFGQLMITGKVGYFGGKSNKLNF